MTPSPEILETMLALYRHMLAGESDAANALISTDPATLLVGSAGEWVDDQAVMRGTYQVDTEGLIAGDHPVAYANGDVGWFADQPIWRFADGSEAQMRMSAVLQREADGWRMVHSHLSVGVPDNECVMLQRRWKHGIPAPQ
ncbi:MAG: SnoaL-like domain [Chloroflexota bacterium]|nr:SnoaL-like domain [Chloroflexota bacterium]